MAVMSHGLCLDLSRRDSRRDFHHRPARRPQLLLSASTGNKLRTPNLDPWPCSWTMGWQAIREFGEESFTREILHIIRGKAEAFEFEANLINEIRPTLNTKMIAA